jgi:hypothetical protein
MGKPGRGHALSLPAEFIGRVEPTQGTETSKYLEEEKSNEIPLVAASERGRAQTGAHASRGCRAQTGLCPVCAYGVAEVHWKVPPKEVTVL